jgi:hypothetical protein
MDVHTLGSSFRRSAPPIAKLVYITYKPKPGFKLVENHDDHYDIQQNIEQNNSNNINTETRSYVILTKTDLNMAKLT